MDAVTIQNWSTTRSESHPDARYLAPEILPLRLQGVVHGHPKGHDGHHICTSAIVTVDGRLVTTRSGTVYRLGRPDRKWLNWLLESGRTYNPKQPIKVIKGSK